MKTPLALCVLLTLTSGCGHEAKPVDPDRLQRMTALRQQLRADLGDRYDDPVTTATPEQIERGSELYPQLCASCHGGRGEGKGHIAEGLLGTPSDFTNPEEATFFSEQARMQIIRKGVPGTAMMGWETVLPEQDILSVYLYIRSLIIQE